MRRLVHPQTGEEIDRALILFFPGPRSFSGEDMAEFHVHGGRSVVSALLDGLLSLPGWRLAERGELTRRAVEGGKMDLTAAEGLAALIDAETPAQRRQALRQMDGHLEAAAGAWRSRLLQALALLEASIDFSDEEDVGVSLSEILNACRAVLTEMEAALDQARAGERLREGLKIVIAGPPNAGKSTLFNALAKRDAAIVSPVPGTTRDVIEVQLDLGGYPAVLMDTAGLRSSHDPVEKIGVARSRARMAEADLILWLAGPGDASEPSAPAGAEVIHVQTKSDLAGRAAPRTGLAISALTGQGLDELLDRLNQGAIRLLGGAESALLTRARHRQHVSAAAGHLRDVLAGSEEPAAELMAEDLRLALRSLGRLTGRIDVEDLLDVIFATFCIGK